MLVAIMQNGSCGVRTLIACQLRFNTSTVALVKYATHKIYLTFHYSNTPFSRWSLGKVLPLRFLGVGQM